MSLLSALVFGGVVTGAYLVVQHFRQDKPVAAEATAPVVALGKPAAPGTAARNNPLAKYLEVVGVRLTQNKRKQTEAHFLVVNHSGADISDLAANVHLMAHTTKGGEEPVGMFSFKLPSLRPYESKELTAVLDTKLQTYELPDWQLLREELEITAPK